MSPRRVPLTILVIGSLPPEVAALVDQGHRVEVAPPALAQYDLILGSACARYLPGMEPFLPQVLKGVMAAKKGKQS